MSRTVSLGLVLTGAGLVVIGLALAWVPLAFIAAGLGVGFVGLLPERDA